MIHTVGPVHSVHEDRSGTLRACYRNALAVAAELGAATVAFPLISAGVYRWPVDEAIAIAADEIGAAPNDGVATLVLFTAETLRRAESIIGG